MTHGKQALDACCWTVCKPPRALNGLHATATSRVHLLPGLHAMTALKAGARHVTAVERWLYLSATAHDALTANGFDRRAFDVRERVSRLQ